jgi:hypothetical protein
VEQFIDKSVNSKDAIFYTFFRSTNYLAHFEEKGKILEDTKWLEFAEEIIKSS